VNQLECGSELVNDFLILGEYLEVPREFRFLDLVAVTLGAFILARESLALVVQLALSFADGDCLTGHRHVFDVDTLCHFNLHALMMRGSAEQTMNVMMIGVKVSTA
jgi:hypothetical protein